MKNVKCAPEWRRRRGKMREFLFSIVDVRHQFFCVPRPICLVMVARLRLLTPTYRIPIDLTCVGFFLFLASSVGGDVFWQIIYCLNNNTKERKWCGGDEKTHPEKSFSFMKIFLRRNGVHVPNRQPTHRQNVSQAIEAVHGETFRINFPNSLEFQSNLRQTANGRRCIVYKLQLVVGSWWKGSSVFYWRACMCEWSGVGRLAVKLNQR